MLVSCLCVLLCQIDCGCLMEPLSSWGNPSCSFNSTDIRKSNTEVIVPACAPGFVCGRGCVCVFARVTTRSADSCCFHGDWFPSRVPGLNHPRRTPFPCDLTSFHFSISLSSTAAACFFIFLFPADDRKRVKCEIRKSVSK